MNTEADNQQKTDEMMMRKALVEAEQARAAAPRRSTT